MECVDSTDVSWISQPQHTIHGFIDSFKESSSRTQGSRDIFPTGLKVKDQTGVLNENEQLKKGYASTSSRIGSVSRRPSFSKFVSAEKSTIFPPTISPNNNNSTSNNNNRRNSWLSSISSKFISTSSHAHLSSSAITTSIPESALENTEPALANDSGSQKNTVLTHAQKHHGDAPYTPALPRTSPAGFLQGALRRLSNSGGQGATTQATEYQESGICERRVLNIDKNRERCNVKGLNEAKLRRVSFCVDVEVAWANGYCCEKSTSEKSSKKGKKLKEKLVTESEQNESLPECGQSIEEGIKSDKVIPSIFAEVNHLSSSIKKTKKMEKKKRNEVERKAKKEKNRKWAEAHGTLPLEVVINNGEEACQIAPQIKTKSQDSSTTDPLRIYRRCCQLRETVEIKIIAEQISNSSNQGPIPGTINRLNLSGHWIETSDLITLGDYLAIVPLTELIMENCCLTDETVRVILAGLLAAKLPNSESCNRSRQNNNRYLSHGFVETVVLKNNPEIGRVGWEYICTFIAMCRSLKSIDLSQIPFPRLDQSPQESIEPLSKEDKQDDMTSDLSDLLKQSLCARAAGKGLQILNLAECSITSDQLANIVDGGIESGLCRLGVAGNKLNYDGIKQVARYIRHGQCIGLDLSNNDLVDLIEIISEVLSENKSLRVLNLADCNLSPESLSILFPALVKLQNFRFIDLSKNPLIFKKGSSALSLFRRYLPQMESLKRMNLMAVSLTLEQAISLAEILPESPNLTYLNIMNNPLRAVIESSCAGLEVDQEEACALYASLMTAILFSKTLICIDIEVPSPDSNEIVKALAKQVVAYCPWSMENSDVDEYNATNFALEMKYDAVPGVSYYIVSPEDEEVPSDCSEKEEPELNGKYYVTGGTSIVRPLSICMQNKGNDSKLPLTSDMISSTELSNSKSNRAKEMSKNSLGTARIVRSCLQAVLKESRWGDLANNQKILLDHTLENLIQHIEDQYPETRLHSTVPCYPPNQNFYQPQSDSTVSDQQIRSSEPRLSVTNLEVSTATSDDESSCIRPMLRKHNSEVSLASRALGEEEGQVFRLSQKLKMDNFKSEEETDPDENGPVHKSVCLEILKEIVGAVNAEKTTNSGTALDS